MSVSALSATHSAATNDAARRPVAGDDPQPRDLQQACRLALATVWLLDAVLQIQPIMFSRGPSGLSAMLRATATGNPNWIRHTITWNASIVDHHPVFTNTLFAAIQFLIGFGIAWKRTSKGVLALSLGWSIVVWWFGEGLGGIFHGAATPLGGGPGGVLFYGLLAVLLWPTQGSDKPFVAARAIGVAAAKATWAAVWIGLAVLSIVGAGRSPKALRELVAEMESKEPGWLEHFDRSTESVLHNHGTAISVSLAVASVAVAAAVYLPPRTARVLLGAAIVIWVIIWVGIQDFGGILTGRATDPGSAPLIVLLVLVHWPLKTRRATPSDAAIRGQRE